MSSAASIKFSQLQNFLGMAEMFPVATSRIHHLAFVTSRSSEGSWHTRQDFLRSFKDFISKQTHIYYCPRLETVEFVHERPALCDFLDGVLVADAQKALNGTLTRVPAQGAGWSGRVSDFSALRVTQRVESIMYEALMRHSCLRSQRSSWIDPDSCHTLLLCLLSDAKKKDLEILLTVNVAFWDDVETVPRNYRNYRDHRWHRFYGIAPGYTVC